MRDFLRDFEKRVPPPPFKVLILQGFRNFGRLTFTFDSHHPLFFMPENNAFSGIFRVSGVSRDWKAQRDKNGGQNLEFVLS